MLAQRECLATVQTSEHIYFSQPKYHCACCNHAELQRNFKMSLFSNKMWSDPLSFIKASILHINARSLFIYLFIICLFDFGEVGHLDIFKTLKGSLRVIYHKYMGNSSTNIGKYNIAEVSF